MIFAMLLRIQEAVNELANKCDLVLVIGSENSSNTQRLAEIVKKKQVVVYRIANANEIKTKWLDRVQNIGITAGASSPEILIKETLDFLKDYYEGVKITTMQGVEEKTVFKPLLNFSCWY